MKVIKKNNSFIYCQTFLIVIKLFFISQSLPTGFVALYSASSSPIKIAEQKSLETYLIDKVLPILNKSLEKL
ncbi:TPA: hypothetical protein QFC13_002333 [Enterococcus faecium]